MRKLGLQLIKSDLKIALRRQDLIVQLYRLTSKEDKLAMAYTRKLREEIDAEVDILQQKIEQLEGAQSHGKT